MSKPTRRTHRMRMICTLKTHVITDEGDFIPAGMPVQVLQWAGPSERSENALDVRVEAYIWSDYEEIGVSDKFDGFVNGGLYIQVKPENLEFKKVEAIRRVE